MVAAATLSPAQAVPVTFAQYVQQNGALQSWAISTTAGTTTVTSNSAVLISFSGVPGLQFVGPESAMFSLSATSNSLGNCGAICAAGDTFSQQGYAGNFSFIGTGLLAGQNLLSGTFATDATPATSGAQLRSTIGSSGGAYTASSNASNLAQLSMTSDYISFAGQTEQNASWSLSSMIPNFLTGPVVAGQARPAAGTFNASGTGTFSSNPGPTSIPIPEPASALVLGAGLMALGTLRRRSKAAAQA